MQQFDAALVRSQVARFMDRSQIPGMAVGVAREGQPLLVEGFGWRNREADLPVTPDTVFGVASVTKSFTALAIMQLADRGSLSVDDPVSRWLPEFRGPNSDWIRGMTIHHFLSHTSGLPGMRALFHARAGSIRQDPNRERLGLVADPGEIRLIRTYQELMELMAETDYELLGPPGTWFNYSNEAYALLQGIIERAGDRPFLDYMQERVLGPLGMSRSCFRTEELATLEPVTELYAAQAVNGKLEVFHAPVWWDVGEIYTNGSLKSSVEDLLRYMEIYRTGGISGEVRLVSADAIRQMTTPHATLPTGRQYGYGLDVQRDYHGVTLVGHGGAIKGVSAHMLVAPEVGISTVALCNLSGATPEQVTLGAVNTALGLEWEERRQEYPTWPVTPAALEEYVGTYRNNEGTSATVQVVEDTLFLVSGGLPLRTRPVGPDLFVLEATGSPVRFLRGVGGKLSALFMGVRVLNKR
ncbi:MAG: serine hydrolase [Bacillota bacterium]